MQFSGARRPRGAAVGRGVAWRIVWIMPKTPMQCSLNFTARWAPFGERRPRSLDLTRLPSSQFTMVGPAGPAEQPRAQEGGGANALAVFFKF